MKVALLKLSAAVLAAALLAGCAGVRAHKGAVVDPQLASAIQPGVDNKTSFEKTLGRPSFTGQFTPNDWYYVSRDTSQFAFRNPRVSQQTVYRVRFDPAGNVVAVDKTGKDMIASVEPSNRKTPTLGRQRSFFDELFGNIGSVGAGGPGQGGPY
jgi:outer membrane protein assembly factor BamE (lipoprotein component of BamABCDE complex)